MIACYSNVIIISGNRKKNKHKYFRPVDVNDVYVFMVFPQSHLHTLYTCNKTIRNEKRFKCK